MKKVKDIDMTQEELEQWNDALIVIKKEILIATTAYIQRMSSQVYTGLMNYLMIYRDLSLFPEIAMGMYEAIMGCM